MDKSIFALMQTRRQEKILQVLKVVCESPRSASAIAEQLGEPVQNISPLLKAGLDLRLLKRQKEYTKIDALGRRKSEYIYRLSGGVQIDNLISDRADPEKIDTDKLVELVELLAIEIVVLKKRVTQLENRED